MRNDNIRFQPDGWDRSGDGGPSTTDPRLQFHTAAGPADTGAGVRNPDIDFEPDGSHHSGGGGGASADPRIQFHTASSTPPGGGTASTPPGTGAAPGGSGIEFLPDSWIRSGSAYRGNATAFTSSAQKVLDSTTSMPVGGANPLDQAVATILGEMSARGTGVISSIGSALGGIGAGMISTGVHYRGLEAEQSSIAAGARGEAS